jgi:hypothetical protein
LSSTAVKFWRDSRPWKSRSIAINAAATKFSRDWLHRGSILRFRKKTASPNKWRYDHGSLFEWISYRHQVWSKPCSRNHFYQNNQLICYCQTAPANQVWFQYHRWSQSIVISHEIQICRKAHGRIHLHFLNAPTPHGLFAMMTRISSWDPHSFIGFGRELSIMIKSLGHFVQESLGFPYLRAFPTGIPCDCKACPSGFLDRPGVTEAPREMDDAKLARRNGRYEFCNE